jgi:hypothetical protein
MQLQRIAVAVLSLVLSAAGLAASVAERSPFAQGHWWDPKRSGNGFEIFNASDQAMAIWYTYDEASRPIWYTAQGRTASLGEEAWPLLKHRWADGRKAEATVVGSLKLTVRHPESIDAAWNIGGKAGTWSIQPFIVSGVVNEVDHSASWFDPANSGWGLTVTEQGDILGGVLYTYDASGAPTWAAGFDRNARGTVRLFATTGACAGCPYTPTVSQPVGSLRFEFGGETELTLHHSLTLPMAAGVNLDGARLAPLSRSASLRKADRQLASFDSDRALKAYLDAGLFNVPPIAYSDFSAPPPAVAFSGTNLQEQGVDEADVVKTNGRHVYTFAHDGYGQRKGIVRVARIGDEGASLDVRGAVTLASGASTPVQAGGLFLHESDLIAVTGASVYGYSGSPWVTSSAWSRGTTYVEILDTADPDLPATRWRAEIDGYLVASRRIGQKLYVVSRFVPDVPGFIFGNAADRALASNLALLASTRLDAMLPKVRINGNAGTPVVGALSTYAPPQGAMKPLANLIVLTAIDLAAPRVVQSMALIGNVDTVYVSATHLYLASLRYELRNAIGVLAHEPPFYVTDIHQVRLGPEGLAIVGSGAVEGVLGGDVDKAAFRLSEHAGKLRAVSSNNTGMWGSSVRNRLTILEPSSVAPGLLRTLSVLPNAQRPEALGKPNEMLHATRFAGDRLYAVTFARIDPLYVVDLSNGADPKITGALEVPGFSEYLHPLPNDVLLGFGYDASPAGINGGLQLSLYDVANAGQPREIQRVMIGKRGSTSALLNQHHAFSALLQADGSGRIAIPVRVHDGPFAEFGSGDSAVYPWQESGVLPFDLTGTGAHARLLPLPRLISHKASGSNRYFSDPASSGGRSILLRRGTIYVGNGQFWRQDGGGNTFGPF